MSHEVLITKRQSIFNPVPTSTDLLRPASAWICKKNKNALSSGYQDLIGHKILTTSPWSILTWIPLLWITTIFDLKPPNLHTYSHQLLGFTIVSRQDAIMRFNVVLFVIISCGLELAVFIHGQHYYYPVAPPSLHCLKKHCDQIVTGKVIIHKSRGEVSLKWGQQKKPVRRA